MTLEIIALVLASVGLVINLGTVVFLWWQFNFTDSRLCKLIDERSKPVEDLSEDDMLEEEEIY